MMTWKLDYRNSVLKSYPEVYTPATLEALEVLVPLNRERREPMRHNETHSRLS